MPPSVSTTLALLGAASAASAAVQAGFSSASTSLTQAVGGGVAGSLSSANLNPNGWAWQLPASNQSAEDWVKANLNVANGRFASNPGNLVFASDPAGAGSSDVLSITYAANSYGLHTSPPGGSAFYPQPFLSSSGTASSNSTPYVVASGTAGQANASSVSRPQLLLAYSVYFPPDFNFVQGGKLPGLYSSVGTLSSSGINASTSGCEGGSLEGAGTSCWSARIMWRAGGQGEIYAYLPQQLGGGYKLCPAKKATAKGASIICNSDYGLSLGRGSFTFRKGSWNDLALYVQVNEPGVANGQIALYVNGASSPTIQLNGVVFRSATTSADALSSPENIAVPTRRDIYDSNGLSWTDKVAFISFFGGNSAAWASPAATQTYFKNIALFSGNSFASGKGKSFTLSPAARPTASVYTLAFSLLAAMAIHALAY